MLTSARLRAETSIKRISELVLEHNKVKLKIMSDDISMLQSFQHQWAKYRTKKIRARKR